MIKDDYDNHKEVEIDFPPYDVMVDNHLEDKQKKMTAFAQCKKCKNLYKFAIIDNKIPPCPLCGNEGITDDGGFLANSINPDNMYPSIEED